MSRPIKEQLPCPKCGNPQPFVRWESLNVTLNPKEKESLLGRKLTSFICGACGHTANVVYPMLYHDMRNAFMVWLIPPQPDGSQGKVADELTAPMLEKMGGRYRFRMVDDQNQLFEKIYIFDAGLDDRIIELAKLIAMQRIPAERRSDSIRLFFSGVSGEGSEAMMNLVATDGKRQAALSVSHEKMYGMLEKNFADALAVKPEIWARIDSNSALQMMTQQKPLQPAKPTNFIPPQQATPIPPPPTPASKKRWWPF